MKKTMVFIDTMTYELTRDDASFISYKNKDFFLNYLIRKTHTDILSQYVLVIKNSYFCSSVVMKAATPLTPPSA